MRRTILAATAAIAVATAGLVAAPAGAALTTPGPADATAPAPASPASASAPAGAVHASVPEQHTAPAGPQRPPVVDLRSEQPVAAGAARHAGAPAGRGAAPARRSESDWL